MKRDEFLKKMGLGALGISIMPLVSFRGLSDEVITKITSNEFLDSNKILIIVNLTGGCDGNGMYTQMESFDTYQFLRPTLYIPKRKLLMFDNDRYGLHPSMAGIHKLLLQGNASLVQQVGVIGGGQSHFKAGHMMNAGVSYAESGGQDAGWLGKFFSRLHPDYFARSGGKYHHPIAVAIGNNSNQNCGSHFGNYGYATRANGRMGASMRGGIIPNNNSKNVEQLKHIQSIAYQKDTFGQTINACLSRGVSRADGYNSSSSFHKNLQKCEKLITGGLQSKVFLLSQGAGKYDQHANQIEGNSWSGLQAELLRDVDVGFFTFFHHLLNIKDSEGRPYIERVTMATLSEFGRSLGQNGHEGTDHGKGNTNIVVSGECIKNPLMGEYPTIDKMMNPRSNMDVKITYPDYYASLLMGIGYAETAINPIFPDKKPEILDIYCSTPIPPPPPPVVVDTDGDGIEDSVDNCISTANPDQSDIDGDRKGDACDVDIDGDGAKNNEDQFPTDSTETVDTDGDGIGDNADTDDDGDGIPDKDDLHPLDPNNGVDPDDKDPIVGGGEPEDNPEEDPVGDFDGDGILDNIDTDDDNDGYSDPVEIREGSDPKDNNSIPPDMDGDLNPDSTDKDRDGDGIWNNQDAYPDDSTRHEEEDEGKEKGKEEGKLKLELFPNPCNDHFFLKMNDSLIDPTLDIDIEVYNVSGKMTGRGFTHESDTLFRVDTSRLSSGVYIVALYLRSMDSRKILASKKFIKNG